MRFTLSCPHCQSRTVAHSGVEVSEVQHELRFSCTDIECGHTFVAMLTAVRTLKPSAKPNANVTVPLSTAVLGEAKNRQRIVGVASKDKSRLPLPLLDNYQINKIRELKAQGLTTAELGERYSVSRSTIDSVLKSG